MLVEGPVAGFRVTGFSAVLQVSWMAYISASFKASGITASTGCFFFLKFGLGFDFGLRDPAEASALNLIVLQATVAIHERALP